VAVLSLRQIARDLNGEVRNDQVLCPGPNHSAADRSLAVKISDSGDDVIVHSFAGDDVMECKKYVRERCGIFRPNGNGNGKFSIDAMVRAAMSAATNHRPKTKPIAVYDYTDADGKLLYQVCRYEPKRFRHRQPDGNDGWIYQGSDRRVLYRLPQLIKYPDASIFICEGEKDADRLASLDLCATTVASGKWTDDCVQALAGRHCYILEDNDEAGRKKALEAATRIHLVAASVKIVRFPSLPSGGDVSDWLDMNRSKHDLEDLCCSAADWEPTAEPDHDQEVEPESDDKDPARPENVAASLSKPTAESEPTRAPLCFVKIENWLDRDPPQRDWAVPDRFPLRNVSLLTGEGSVGKTIALMQLAAAHVFGRGWLDTLPEPGDAIYLNAEDEEDELHRRFIDIARLYDSPLGELKDHLHLLALAGKDAILAHANTGGIVKPTRLFRELTEAVGDIKPKLIALDTSADIFAGNESDRSQVRQFIGLLRGMSIAGNSAVIVCAHPSLTGISTGTGLSGSTAWHNSVRARAYLHSVKVEDTEPDKTLRQLDFMKSNYSAIADSITLRWKDGVFVPEAKPGSLEKMAADAKADDAFLGLLNKLNAQGRVVSHSIHSGNYAPKVFAAEQDGKDVGAR